MKNIHQKITVSYEYDVLFSDRIFETENSALKNVIEKNSGTQFPYRILFVLEKALLQHYPELCDDITNYCNLHSQTLKMTAPPSPIQGGESFKDFSSIESLCQLFATNNLCRHSFVAIIGGGAFLDSVGLAASLVHRGIRQIRIPTTVLSQCDSGVGVKNGINMFGKKNFAGTFAPPYAVINDSNFLQSLGYRDWISGVPEAIKVAMIKDAEFFEWLIANAAKFAERDLSAMKYLIAKCAELHLNHIATSGDPFEFGSARPLDFGHWAAHKLEMLTKGALRHGEAVAIGILIDTFYAVQAGYLNEELLPRLLAAYKTMQLPIYVPELIARNQKNTLSLLAGIEDFREHLGGELHITMPNKLGSKIEISKINTDIVIEGIEFLKQESSRQSS